MNPPFRHHFSTRSSFTPQRFKNNSFQSFSSYNHLGAGPYCGARRQASERFFYQCAPSNRYIQPARKYWSSNQNIFNTAQWDHPRIPQNGNYRRFRPHFYPSNGRFTSRSYGNEAYQHQYYAPMSGINETCHYNLGRAERQGYNYNPSFFYSDTPLETKQPANPPSHYYWEDMCLDSHSHTVSDTDCGVEVNGECLATTASEQSAIVIKMDDPRKVTVIPAVSETACVDETVPKERFECIQESSMHKTLTIQQNNAEFFVISKIESLQDSFINANNFAGGDPPSQSSVMLTSQSNEGHKSVAFSDFQSCEGETQAIQPTVCKSSDGPVFEKLDVTCCIGPSTMKSGKESGYHFKDLDFIHSDDMVKDFSNEITHASNPEPQTSDPNQEVKSHHQQINRIDIHHIFHSHNELKSIADPATAVENNNNLQVMGVEVFHEYSEGESSFNATNSISIFDTQQAGSLNFESIEMVVDCNNNDDERNESDMSYMKSCLSQPEGNKFTLNLDQGAISPEKSKNSPTDFLMENLSAEVCKNTHTEFISQENSQKDHYFDCGTNAPYSGIQKSEEEVFSEKTFDGKEMVLIRSETAETNDPIIMKSITVHIPIEIYLKFIEDKENVSGCSPHSIKEEGVKIAECHDRFQEIKRESSPVNEREISCCSVKGACHNMDRLLKLKGRSINTNCGDDKNHVRNMMRVVEFIGGKLVPTTKFINLDILPLKYIKKGRIIVDSIPLIYRVDNHESKAKRDKHRTTNKSHIERAQPRISMTVNAMREMYSPMKKSKGRRLRYSTIQREKYRGTLKMCLKRLKKKKPNKNSNQRKKNLHLLYKIEEMLNLPGLRFTDSRAIRVCKRILYLLTRAGYESKQFFFGVYWFSHLSERVSMEDYHKVLDEQGKRHNYVSSFQSEDTFHYENEFCPNSTTHSPHLEKCLEIERDQMGSVDESIEDQSIISVVSSPQHCVVDISQYPTREQSYDHLQPECRADSAESLFTMTETSSVVEISPASPCEEALNNIDMMSRIDTNQSEKLIDVGENFPDDLDCNNSHSSEDEFGHNLAYEERVHSEDVHSEGVDFECVKSDSSVQYCAKNLNDAGSSFNEESLKVTGVKLHSETPLSSDSTASASQNLNFGTCQLEAVDIGLSDLPSHESKIDDFSKCKRKDERSKYAARNQNSPVSMHKAEGDSPPSAYLDIRKRHKFTSKWIGAHMKRKKAVCKSCHLSIKYHRFGKCVFKNDLGIPANGRVYFDTDYQLHQLTPSTIPQDDNLALHQIVEECGVTLYHPMVRRPDPRLEEGSPYLQRL